ncbi:MAG: DUF2240 family protein [Thermoplasmatota archaeon]
MEAGEEAIVAFSVAARREGRRRMPAGEWARLLSLGFGWMTPAEGRRYVEKAQAAGILVERDGEWECRVTAEAPLGFRPDPGGEPAPVAPDPFAALLQEVATRTGRPRDQVLGQVAALQARVGGWMTAHAALLAVARETGMDVAPRAAAALAALRG